MRNLPFANELLAALPRRAWRELSPELEPLTLVFGEVLHEPRAVVRYVYFPCGAMVSLLAPVEGRRALEVGLVGREGVVGVTPCQDAPSPVRSLVQGEGGALRIGAARFRAALARHPALRRGLERHQHALMSQVMQTAACNRFHVVELRLARWLLMTRDRMRANEFRMTHQFLSQMLGVRRVGVTEAAGALQGRGLIAYRRGVIRILDPRGLEAACCSCYSAAK